ncbi:hypothetical protein Cpir12675_002233 [Ceratocystis pirilliformis]|uniref:Oxidoreductase n=1 Tax=Ceratocystis pirilliformis TaxID=259994 RepID=A0ABR3ZBN9_9PEZI
MAPLNVGIIGYGLSAKVFHIPFVSLVNDLSLYAIVQRTPSAASSAPDDHPSVKHYTSTDALFADSAIDIVIITTPPNSHFALTKAAIEAGKHVLCEKPFVPTSAEATTLVDLAKQKGVLLCVYQNRRWDADFQTLKQLIDAGTLGRVFEFQTHFDRYRPNKSESWKTSMTLADGNGPVFDLGSHLIDQVYFLYGMPDRVYGNHVSQRDGVFTVDQADSLNAQLSYDKLGLCVFVRISAMSAELYQPRFWVRGTKGSFFKTGLDPQEMQLKGGMTFDDPNLGVEGVKWHGQLTRLQNDTTFVKETVPTIKPTTYRPLFEKLASAVASGKWEDLPVPADQARDVLKIIEAVIKSSQEGIQVSLQD